MQVQEHVALAPLTNMRVGGSARYYIEIFTKQDWADFVDWKSDLDIPVVLLGGGNNVVFSDDGLDGIVVCLKNDGVAFRDTFVVEVEAGVMMGALISACRKKGYFGLEGFVGIPGSVGACVRGNIGIPNCEMQDFVVEVEAWTDDGRFESFVVEQCEYEYRSSALKRLGLFVWSTRLQLLEAPTIDVDEQMMKRLAKQPKGKTCGSFFTNPDWRGGLYAGKLAEECGLKGSKVGGAFLSEKHGNWIMNDGSATSADVLALARHIRDTVQNEKGIVLHEEVMIYDVNGRILDL